MDIELLAKEPGQSIRQWVYDVLRNNIIKLHLTPGLAISETEIADLLKISRTPVREGFIRLVEDGLLEIYSQKGSFISLIDLEQAEEARFVRRVLEKEIITEASEDFPEQSLFDLSANLELQKFCQKEKNYERMFELDNEFHRIIYHGCGKERTWLHIRKMNYNFDRLRVLRLSAQCPWDIIIKEHDAIAQVIIQQQPTKVEEVVDTHLARALVEEFALEHPEYFKQDLQTYFPQKSSS